MSDASCTILLQDCLRLSFDPGNGVAPMTRPCTQRLLAVALTLLLSIVASACSESLLTSGSPQPSPRAPRVEWWVEYADEQHTFTLMYPTGLLAPGNAPRLLQEEMGAQGGRLACWLVSRDGKYHLLVGVIPMQVPKSYRRLPAAVAKAMAVKMGKECSRVNPDREVVATQAFTLSGLRGYRLLTEHAGLVKGFICKRRSKRRTPAT